MTWENANVLVNARCSNCSPPCMLHRPVRLVVWRWVFWTRWTRPTWCSRGNYSHPSEPFPRNLQSYCWSCCGSEIRARSGYFWLIKRKIATRKFSFKTTGTCTHDTSPLLFSSFPIVKSSFSPIFMSGLPIKKLFMFTCPATSHRTTLPLEENVRRPQWESHNHNARATDWNSGLQIVMTSATFVTFYSDIKDKNQNKCTYIWCHHSCDSFNDVHKYFVLSCFLWRATKHRNFNTRREQDHDKAQRWEKGDPEKTKMLHSCCKWRLFPGFAQLSI